MKDFKDINKAPSLVQHVYACKIARVPISGALLEDAISKHPEYFPEEAEYRRKYNSIPESVHNEYKYQMQELTIKYYKENARPFNYDKGLMFLIQNPDKMKELNDYNNKMRESLIQEAKKIADKFYLPYGIDIPINNIIL